MSAAVARPWSLQCSGVWTWLGKGEAAVNRRLREMLVEAHALAFAEFVSGGKGPGAGKSDMDGGLGMRFNAGHALNYFNVQPVAALPGVRELHIGHAIVARALFVGLREAVREMKRLMTEAAWAAR